jgi:hypothetical protein
MPLSDFSESLYESRKAEYPDLLGKEVDNSYDPASWCTSPVHARVTRPRDFSSVMQQGFIGYDQWPAGLWGPRQGIAGASLNIAGGAFQSIDNCNYAPPAFTTTDAVVKFLRENNFFDVPPIQNPERNCTTCPDDAGQITALHGLMGGGGGGNGTINKQVFDSVVTIQDAWWQDRLAGINMDGMLRPINRADEYFSDEFVLGPGISRLYGDLTW